MHKLIAITLFCLAATPVFAADKLETDDQKTLYALGQAVGRQLEAFKLSTQEQKIIQQGTMDYLNNKPSEVDMNVYGPMIQKLAQSRLKIEGEKQAALGKEFLEKAAKEKGAIKTDSGLIYVSLQEGAGASPTATDTVKVNYRGALIDGKEFDSSYKRKAPIEFKLDGVIKCWTEGVQKMKVGGKSKLVCPSSIAYGENGAGGSIPPNSTLIFEVELLDIKK